MLALRARVLGTVHLCLRKVQASIAQVPQNSPFFTTSNAVTCASHVCLAQYKQSAHHSERSEESQLKNATPFTEKETRHATSLQFSILNFFNG